MKRRSCYFINRIRVVRVSPADWSRVKYTPDASGVPRSSLPFHTTSCGPADSALSIRERTCRPLVGVAAPTPPPRTGVEQEPGGRDRACWSHGRWGVTGGPGSA